jgi:hypothetical protein
MDSASLFMDLPAKTTVAARPAPPAIQLAQQVSDMVASVDAEPLAETLEALQRLPDTLRPVAAMLATEMYQEFFCKLATQLVSERSAMDDSARGRVDPARAPHMLAHSAKIQAMSAVTSLASQPWHVADPKTLAGIVADIERSGDFGYARKRLMGLSPVNLFVAAGPKDDRDSYLTAVTAAVKSRRVHHVVLDAELIEWFPAADFLAACAATGLRPRFVGLCERHKVGQHQMMFPCGGLDRLAGVVVDTAGRVLGLDAHGAVSAPPAPCRLLKAAPVQATKETTVPQEPAAPTATTAQRQSAAPPTGVQAKIAALRDQQRRRAGARP